MRNAFIDELVFQATTNDRIALVVGDLGYSVVEPFSERFPERFINAGVAEQNMMSMAAGMASEGYHVFVYSIANFPTFRCAEQIRNDIAYHQLPVTVVSVGGGLSYGNLGYSHHAIQDYALLRVMPNILIAAPGDPMEVKGCIKYLVNKPCPSYLRLGRAGEINIHPEIPNINPGEWLKINQVENAQYVYLSTGTTLCSLHEKLLYGKNTEIALFSMPLWGMHYKTMQVKNVEPYTTISTFEDHLVDGGFGSWLLESMQENTKYRSKIKINGLSDNVAGMVGSNIELCEISGLYKELDTRFSF